MYEWDKDRRMPLVPFKTLYKSILRETSRDKGRVFLADGAIGTELMRQGIKPRDILKANVVNSQIGRAHV